MGLIEAMSDLASHLIASASELSEPRGLGVIIARKTPDELPTNESLSVFGTTQAMLDQGIQPVIVFEDKNVRNPGHRGQVVQRLAHLVSDGSGKPRMVICEPHETITQAIDRARTGLAELPVLSVVVGYPPSAKRIADPGGLPRTLREHFMSDENRIAELPVVALYADAQLHSDQRVTVSTGFGEKIHNQLEIDTTDLIHYNGVVVPNAKLAKQLSSAAESRIDSVFRGAYELVDDESGNLSISELAVPRARFVTHEMAPEVRAFVADAWASVLRVPSTLRVTERGIEVGLERGLQQSQPQAQTQSSQSAYTLGA